MWNNRTSMACLLCMESNGLDGFPTSCSRVSIYAIYDCKPTHAQTKWSLDAAGELEAA